MNTFWLKIAGAAIGVVVIIILISILTSGGTKEPEPQQPQKTFYDQAEEDKQRFLAEPQALDSQEQRPTETKTATQQVQPIQEPPESVTLYFKELNEIEKIEAERLLNVAVPGRSIGRLPMTGYNLMIDSCRQIIRRWPDSWYAYRAKQMLADIPDRYQQQYNITKEEMDVSMYAKPRAGTKPYMIK